MLKAWIWYRCQKRKLFHYDEKQLGFYKKVHIKTQGKKKDVLVIFILLQKNKNSSSFDKNCTQENVKCHIQHEECWLRWIIIEQVKLQVTLLFAYISWKKLFSHTFKASLEEVIVMHSEKMKAKYMKDDVWKSFFW